ncbi:MAG: TIR domain-containing protein [Quadrisphaera sp.]
MTAAAAEPTEYDFDLAVSFAGEDRSYVEEFVRGIQKKDIKVFYDEDQAAETWGEELTEFFENVYQNRAHYVVMFISRHYVEKSWAILERRSALAKALELRRAYVLPVRLDDTPVPGLRATVGYLDSRRLGLPRITEIAQAKLAGTQAARASSLFRGVPKTPEEIEMLTAERSRAWEYRLYAGALKQGMRALEDRYRDHVMELSRPRGRTLDDSEARNLLEDSMSSAQDIIDNFGKVLSHEAQDAAFGLPGEPGDAGRIMHLAAGYVTVYEDFLQWSQDLRDARVRDDTLKQALRVASRFVTPSLLAMRSMVASLSEECETLLDRLDAGEKIHVTLEVVLDLDDATRDELSNLLDRYRRENGL